MAVDPESKEAMWYWNTFAKANHAYQSLVSRAGSDPASYDKKIKLLEIMNGSLIGFIEENFKLKSPVLSGDILSRENLETIPTEEQ